MKQGLKKLMALGLVAVMSLGMVGCNGGGDSDNEAKKDTLAKIEERGTLIVGTSPDYPPFEFMVSEDGKSKIAGVDISMSEMIAEDLGVKLEVKPMNFDALIPAVQAGTVDMVVAGLSPNPEREKAVDFSDVYFKGVNSVITLDGDQINITSEDDLKKAKIGVQKGSTQEVYVTENLKATNTKSLVAIPDLVMDLKNGNIDAIVLNSKVAKINEGKYDGLKVVENLELTGGGDEEAMAIAFKKGENKELVEKINAEIKRLHDTGKYDELLANAVELVAKEKK